MAHWGPDLGHKLLPPNLIKDSHPRLNNTGGFTTWSVMLNVGRWITSSPQCQQVIHITRERESIVSLKAKKIPVTGTPRSESQRWPENTLGRQQINYILITQGADQRPEALALPDSLWTMWHAIPDLLNKSLHLSKLRVIRTCLRLPRTKCLYF